MKRGTHREYVFDPIRGFHADETPDAPADHPRLDELPPFLRALLVTDGTVTRFLEAFTWEPIEVRLIDQAETILESEIPELELGPGQSVVKRQVLLHGASTGRNYTFAESLIRTDRLWDGLREELLKGRLGMGEILRDRRMETYREILSLREEKAETLPGPMNVDGRERVLVRSYRIFHRQAPVILITEKFPCCHFLPPAA